jgi:hypothetical protein
MSYAATHHFVSCAPAQRRQISQLFAQILPRLNQGLPTGHRLPPQCALQRDVAEVIDDLFDGIEMLAKVLQPAFQRR